MTDFLDLIQVLAPASLVLYLAYLLVRSFLNKQLAEMKLQMVQKNQEVIIPVRLQAYERICLLLERISPSNLITRLNNSEYTSQQLQTILVSEVREEFNHNLSQQVYMTNEAWEQVSNAVESTLTLINEAGGETAPDDKSLSLAKKIFELNMAKPSDQRKEALTFVKAEIQAIF